MSMSNVLQTKPMQTSTANSQEQSQRGQALLEFALVLMFVILPFTFVLVDGALTLFTLANVTNAAREGARAGSIYQSGTVTSTLTFSAQVTAVDNARLNYIKAYLGVSGATGTPDLNGRLRNLVNVNQCNIQVTYPVAAAVGNPYRALDSMTLQVACPHRLLFGLVGVGSITLSAQSTMKIEPGGALPQ